MRTFKQKEYVDYFGNKQLRLFDVPIPKINGGEIVRLEYLDGASHVVQVASDAKRGYCRECPLYNMCSVFDDPDAKEPYYVCLFRGTKIVSLDDILENL